MDHVKILKRAWQIVTRYRATWVFGVILALATFFWTRVPFSRGSGSSSRSGAPSAPPTIDLNNSFFSKYLAGLDKDFAVLSQALNDFFGHDPLPVLITLGVVVVVIILVLIIISVIARNVSETALIKMIDQYEGTGEPVSVRQGLRMGWSRAAWRMFLINLLVDGVLTLVLILALVLAISPLLLFLLDISAVSIISAVAVTGLVFLVIFLAIIAGEGMGLVKLFAYRACALGDLGVIDALRRGYSLIRLHLKDVGLMWLLVLGIRIGWPIVMFLVGILAMIVAAISGIVAALLAGLIGGLVLKGLVLLLVVFGVGALVFLVVLVIPLAFLDGLQKVFLSSAWTLTYQELRTLDDLAVEQPPIQGLGVGG